MTELERLQKEINGKRIWWRSDNGGRLLHAICLWEPDGDVISVKPYGLTPQEIIDVCYWHTEEDIAQPSFCLADLRIRVAIAAERLDELMPNLLFLAEGPEGVVYDPRRREGGCGGDPFCPYG